jgi:hypothetical protein
MPLSSPPSDDARVYYSMHITVGGYSEFEPPGNSGLIEATLDTGSSTLSEQDADTRFQAIRDALATVPDIEVTMMKRYGQQYQIFMPTP